MHYYSEKDTDSRVDMALGYFSNVEFVTNLEMPFRFVREMCQFARLAVEEMQKAKENSFDIDPSQSTPLSRDNMMDMLAFERLDNFPLHVRVSFFEPFSFHLQVHQSALCFSFLGFFSFLSFLYFCGEVL